MDPLSVIASVTGIIAFTTKTVQGIIALISDARDAPTAVIELQTELENLNMVLRSAGIMLDKHPFKPEAVTFLETIEKCIKSCQDSVCALTNALKDVMAPGYGKGTRYRVAMRSRWVVRKHEIMSHRSKLLEARASLNLIISVSNAYLGGKGQEEIHNDIRVLYRRLRKDFASNERARVFRTKVEDDLRSVTVGSRPSSAAGRTDVGYTMEMFMDQLENAEAPMESGMSDSNHLMNRRSLFEAVASGDAQRVTHLISEQVSITGRFHNGLTILHLCALYDEPYIVEIALENGVNIDAKDTQERLTPFQLAVREQSWGVAELLANRGCALGGFGTSQLLDIIDRYPNDILIMKPFIEGLARRIKRWARNIDVISESVDANNIQAIRLLLEAGFSPNTPEVLTNILPIHRAIIHRNIASLQLLLEHGADPTSIWFPPSTSHFLDMTNPLHKKFKERENEGAVTTLLLAMYYTDDVDFAMTQLLLECGAEPNVEIPGSKTTALLYVCERKQFEYAKVLIEAGANIHHVDASKKTAMHWAIVYDNIQLVELLLACGPSPNKSGDSPSPLSLATSLGRETIASLLVRHGANLTSNTELVDETDNVSRKKLHLPERITLTIS
ncbi:ankyrin repeat-containing domain protein [Xylaria cf. heliscus]|nr:ankyrin repeat-containing domain protein [Xylaria cf. heliscus]